MMAVTVSCYADVDVQAIALNCMNCHRDKVEQVGDIPSLEKLTETELRQALLDFKTEKKAATLMPRIVKAYSDSQLAAVAAYLKRR